MILVFSGTGNSRRVANRLSELLGDAVVNIAQKLPTIPHGERVVWVFPVYSWGVPPIVRAQMRKINLAEAGDNFAVMTCGDDCGLTYKMWRSDVAAIGGRAVSTHSVQMPNIYVTMKGFDVDSTELANAKLDASESRIAVIADDIKSKAVCDDIVKGSFAWIKTRIIYPWFVRYAMSPKPFHATDACTRCGACAKACPVDNITMSDSSPCWGNKCAGCLRCYHLCPQRAVAYGSTTKNKGQYRQSLKYILHDK